MGSGMKSARGLGHFGRMGLYRPTYIALAWLDPNALTYWERIRSSICEDVCRPCRARAA